MRDPLDSKESPANASPPEEVDEATRKSAERAVRWILVAAAVCILLPLILGVIFLR